MRPENLVRSVFSADVFASYLTLVCYMYSYVHAISLTFDWKLETVGNLIHDKIFFKSIDSECFELV